MGQLFDPGWDAKYDLVVPVDDPDDPTVVSWFTPFHETGLNHSDILQHLKVPYFLDDTETNRKTITGRVEFFLGAKGKPATRFKRNTKQPQIWSSDEKFFQIAESMLTLILSASGC